jgi:predicted enzyme related to lactoylglutathione lyase
MAKVRKQPTKKAKPRVKPKAKAPTKKAGAKAKAKANKTKVKKVTAKAKAARTKPPPPPKPKPKTARTKPPPPPKPKPKPKAARPKPPPPPRPKAKPKAEAAPAAPSPAAMAAAAQGRFVWHDLMTTDADAALSFYGRLLGWKFEDIDADGTTAHVIRVAGVSVGAVMPEKGLPTSHWIPYVSVDDVEVTCRTITELGGNVALSAMDVPDFGRFAVANDPEGAFFSPVTRSAHAQAAGEARGHIGAFVWDELVTSDPEAAVDFYRQLFAWSIERLPQEPPYWLASLGGDNVCGLMPFPDGDDARQERPLWLPYVAVADVDVSTREAAELGGVVQRAPRDIPGIGRFSVVSDPTGALVALFKPLPRSG